MDKLTDILGGKIKLNSSIKMSSLSEKDVKVPTDKSIEKPKDSIVSIGQYGKTKMTLGNSMLSMNNGLGLLPKGGKNRILGRDENFSLLKKGGVNMLGRTGNNPLLGKSGHNPLMGKIGSNPMMARSGSNPLLGRSKGNLLLGVRALSPIAPKQSINMLESSMRKHIVKAPERHGWWRVQQQTGLPMFGDYDKDGVPNILDCQPRNRRRQGPENNIDGEAISVPLETYGSPSEKVGGLETFDTGEGGADSADYVGRLEKYSDTITYAPNPKGGEGEIIDVVAQPSQPTMLQKAGRWAAKVGKQAVTAPFRAAAAGYDVAEERWLASKERAKGLSARQLMAAEAYMAAKDPTARKKVAEQMGLSKADIAVLNQVRPQELQYAKLKQTARQKAIQDIETAKTYAVYSKQKREAYKPLLGESPAFAQTVRGQIYGGVKGFASGLGGGGNLLMMGGGSGMAPSLSSGINLSGPVSLMPVGSSFGQPMIQQQPTFAQPPMSTAPQRPTVISGYVPTEEGQIWSPLSRRYVRYPRGPYKTSPYTYQQ